MALKNITDGSLSNSKVRSIAYGALAKQLSTLTRAMFLEDDEGFLWEKGDRSSPLRQKIGCCVSKNCRPRDAIVPPADEGLLTGKISHSNKFGGRCRSCTCIGTGKSPPQYIVCNNIIFPIASW